MIMLFESKLKESTLLRIIIMGVLTLALLIPMTMILHIIDERQTRRDGVIEEISAKWGQAQTFAGPILSIPYKNAENTTYVHLLANNLKIKGKVEPIVRYRGIFEAMLYNAKLDFTGEFDLEDLNIHGFKSEALEWEQAFISFGITDMSGIQEEINFDFNNKTIEISPGLLTNQVIYSGISAKIALDPMQKNYDFSVKVTINGSEKIQFIPTGKTTEVKIESAWKNPSFTGDYLPDDREITTDYFNAYWKILHFNRNYPQTWLNNRYNINNSAFGVSLLLPVDQYQKTTRVAKYAILFLVLTFAAFFILEILNKTVLHPIQYLLIGLALVLFYSLLLAFTEHIPFSAAYFITSISIIALITFYTYHVLPSAAKLIAFILSGLYLFLFIILQQQDYSILLGSIGLLILLAAVMYFTRNINWFTVFETSTIANEEVVEKIEDEVVENKTITKANNKLFKRLLQRK